MKIKDLASVGAKLIRMLQKFGIIVIHINIFWLLSLLLWLIPRKATFYCITQTESVLLWNRNAWMNCVVSFRWKWNHTKMLGRKWWLPNMNLILWNCRFVVVSFIGWVYCDQAVRICGWKRCGPAVLFIISFICAGVFLLFLLKHVFFLWNC